MGRSDPGPHKYKESNKIDNKFNNKTPNRDKYWTELLLRSKNNQIVPSGFNTTPGAKFLQRYPPDNGHKFVRSKSEHDCSVAHYEYYLRHNLYIKSAVEKQNVLSFQIKKVSFRNYTPKSLSQEVNLGMWI